ncbi:MAG TPA: hypothetical protein VFK02_21775 [Kofleriaceae bacterium]|nr:hypothetical protein [Kofleriaceae bacterium]
MIVAIWPSATRTRAELAGAALGGDHPTRVSRSNSAHAVASLGASTLSTRAGEIRAGTTSCDPLDSLSPLLFGQPAKM